MTEPVNLAGCVAPPSVNSNKGSARRFIALRAKSIEGLCALNDDVYEKYPS